MFPLSAPCPSLPFSLFSKRDPRFTPFYAHRGPTFDLVLEDRLPLCVAHTSAFECNSVADDGDAGGVKRRMTGKKIRAGGMIA